MISVAASRIHGRDLRLKDQVLSKASLFPYFDGEGTVSVLMVVWPEAPDIVLLPFDGSLVQVPWWGPSLMNARRAGLVNCEAGTARELAGHLWHYDPWWVLAEHRFKGHPAVPVLKATNCVDLFRQPVLDCHYDRTLSRLTALTLPASTEEGGTKREKFVAGWLPEPDLAQRRPRRRDWKLAPFWQRRS